MQSYSYTQSGSAPVVELSFRVVVRVEFMSSISVKRCVHCAGMLGHQLYYWSATRLPIFQGVWPHETKSYIVQYMTMDYYVITGRCIHDAAYYSPYTEPNMNGYLQYCI